MNRPRIGERYEACAHATPGKQHWWSVKGRWIALCAVCHKAFAAKKPVALKAATRTLDDDRPLMDLSTRKPEVLNFDFPWGGRASANKKSEG